MKIKSLLIAFSGILVSIGGSAKQPVKNPLVEKAGQRPNIIFIYADDWGYGDLSCHGHKGLRTPNLDKMAAEGLEFLQFNVCNPVCSPSRTAIITGRYPARYSIHQHFASHDLNMERGMPDWLDPHTTTLPRILKEAGYSTAHYGKWHLTNAGVNNPPLPAEYGYDDTKVFNGPGPQVAKLIGESTSACVDYTIDFIKKHQTGPFFVNLWIHEAHQPIEPNKEALNAYPNTKEPFKHYYACITYADKQLGRLFQYLKENGLEENTLVIFSSDNGPEQSSKDPKNKLWYSRGETGGLIGYKRSLFEGGVGLPFIVRWPGKVPVGIVNNTTNLAGVDVLPSLCHIAGVKLPEGYTSDGEDLSRAFWGEPIKRTKPLFWEWRGTEHDLDWPRLAVRDGDWKLLSNYDGSHQVLYNIQKNRKEINDLSSSNPEKVKELFKMVTDWKATLPEHPDSSCIGTP
jgi:N-acetylgalactosamine-6-sulfatase